MKNYKLSPSDFAFLWEECRYCFWKKVVEGLNRPRSPMPKIFTKIDTAMKKRFTGVRTENIAEGLPPGAVLFGEKWVQSGPIYVPIRNSSCFIKGKIDTALKFDDGTFGLLDFKTSESRAEHVPLYRRQLHAYAYALEHSAPGKLALSPVSKLGLIVFEPETFESEHIPSASLQGSVTWMEIQRDDRAFLEFISEVLAVLDFPSPPEPGQSCGFCQYANAIRQKRHSAIGGASDANAG